MRSELVLCIFVAVDLHIETARPANVARLSSEHAILPRKSFSGKGKNVWSNVGRRLGPNGRYFGTTVRDLLHQVPDRQRLNSRALLRQLPVPVASYTQKTLAIGR